MEKKITVVFLIISILLSGCTREIPENSGSSFELPQSQSSTGGSQKSSVTEENMIPESSDTWRMKEEYRKIEPAFSNSISSLYGLGLMPGHILFSATQSDMQNYRTVMEYDLKNDVWHEIGNYNEISVMSESQLQIGEKNYFAYEDVENQYRMVCIDILEQEINFPNTFEFNPPLASYEASENGRFFLYLPDTNSSEERQYHIYLYNTAGDEYREIVTKKYSETTDSGTIVKDISAQGQQLYLCCGVYENGQYEYKIITYNFNGEQQEKIVLEDLKKRLKENDEQIKSFHVLGDCFFFETFFSGSQYLYTYENGSLQPIDLPSEHLKMDSQRGDNIRDNEVNPYYYFWDYNTKTLYPFNCQTKAFSKLHFSPEEDENLSISIWDDADGNILMSYYISGQLIPDYYYIPQSTILKYMES